MQRKLSSDLEENKRLFQEIFQKDAMLRLREISPSGGGKYLLLYLDGMVSGDTVNEAVIKPLVLSHGEMGTGRERAKNVTEKILFAGEVSEKKLPELIKGLLYGDSVLLIDGCDVGLQIDTKGFRTRGIDEPENESVEQGPREGFAEAVLPNLSLIRRKLLTTDLCIEMMRIGRRSDTKVFLCYLGSLAKPSLVEEMKKRVSKIDIDGILDSNYINELTRDHPYSLFRTMGKTERPDVVASKLLEGRVAVVVDGTPVVLTAPYLFSENFQSDEDYYISFWSSSVGRCLRYVCFFLTVTVPALYLALATLHQRLLPTFLLLSTAQSRAGVPFSSLTEALGLILTLEILKETGARMSQNAGHTLSIVGGLVVGQAAVEARLVSATMLIVIALSGIAGLMVPRLRSAVFYWRLALLFFAYVLGIPGIFLGLTLLMIRLFGLSSFGTPYLQSLETPTVQGLKDTVVRLPWDFMIRRPVFNKNKVRQKRRKEE